VDAWRFGYGVPEVARGSGEGIEDAGNAGQGRAEMEARRDVEGICEVAGRRGRAEASAACGVQGGVTLEQAGDVFAFHDLGSRSSEPEAAGDDMREGGAEMARLTTESCMVGVDLQCPQGSIAAEDSGTRCDALEESEGKRGLQSVEGEAPSGEEHFATGEENRAAVAACCDIGGAGAVVGSYGRA